MGNKGCSSIISSSEQYPEVLESETGTDFLEEITSLIRGTSSKMWPKIKIKHEYTYK